MALVKLFLSVLIVSEALLVSVIACSNNRPWGYSWDTHWHQHFAVKCQTGSVINYWRSMHRDCKEDRVNYIKCVDAPGSKSDYTDCSWPSLFLNRYDEILDYTCPNNGFITGIQAKFHGYYKDRMWAFHCCRADGYYSHSCQYSTYQNWWDGPIYYRVPTGYYLVGVYSYHHDYYEDRRWKFQICKFSQYK